jgi:hypothetical protein
MNKRQKELFVKEDLANDEFQELFEIIEKFRVNEFMIDEYVKYLVEIIETETIETDIQNELELLLENVESDVLVKEVILYFTEKHNFLNMNYDWSRFLFEECNTKIIIELIKMEPSKDYFLKYLKKETKEIQELIDEKVNSCNSTLEMRLKVIDEIFSELS